MNSCVLNNELIPVGGTGNLKISKWFRQRIPAPAAVCYVAKMRAELTTSQASRRTYQTEKWPLLLQLGIL